MATVDAQHLEEGCPQRGVVEWSRRRQEAHDTKQDTIRAPACRVLVGPERVKPSRPPDIETYGIGIDGRIRGSCDVERAVTARLIINRIISRQRQRRRAALIVAPAGIDNRSL